MVIEDWDVPKVEREKLAEWLEFHLFGTVPKAVDTKCTLFYDSWLEFKKCILDGKLD